MSAVILQDELVHYEVLGRGRPVIFLHGWVGSWRYWIPTMQAASIHFRTYALDLWGFGDTAKNPSRYSLDNQVNLLDSFIHELGIGKIALVGHGLGAVAGMLFTMRRSATVDRMMAVALPNGAHALNPRLYSAEITELVEWLLSRAPVSNAAREDAPKADERAIRASLAGMERIPLDRLQQQINIPCLVVYGKNDPSVAGPSVLDRDTLPENIHQVIFEDSGHFPMLDEATKFNRLLADFLALPSGLSPQQLQIKDEWKRRVR